MNFEPLWAPIKIKSSNTKIFEYPVSVNPCLIPLRNCSVRLWNACAGLLSRVIRLIILSAWKPITLNPIKSGAETLEMMFNPPPWNPFVCLHFPSFWWFFLLYVITPIKLNPIESHSETLEALAIIFSFETLLHVIILISLENSDKSDDLYEELLNWIALILARESLTPYQRTLFSPESLLYAFILLPSGKFR